MILDEYDVTMRDVEENRAEAMKILAGGIKSDYAKKMGHTLSVFDTENTISLKSISESGKGNFLSGLGFGLGVLAGVAYALGFGFMPAGAGLAIMVLFSMIFYKSNVAKMLGLYVAGTLSTAVILMVVGVALIQFDVNIFGRTLQKAEAFGNTLLLGNIDTPFFIFTSTFAAASINAVIALFISIVCFTAFSLNENKNFNRGNISAEMLIATIVFILTFLGVNVGTAVSMILMIMAVIYVSGLIKNNIISAL